MRSWMAVGLILEEAAPFGRQAAWLRWRLGCLQGPAAICWRQLQRGGRARSGRRLTYACCGLLVQGAFARTAFDVQAFLAELEQRSAAA